jgi:hypothetical protein
VILGAWQCNFGIGALIYGSKCNFYILSFNPQRHVNVFSLIRDSTTSNKSRSV